MSTRSKTTCLNQNGLWTLAIRDTPHLGSRVGLHAGVFPLSSCGNLLPSSFPGPPHLPSSPSGARREAFTIIALAWSTQHYPRLVSDWSAARSWDPIQEYEERLPSDPELAAASQGSRPSAGGLGSRGDPDPESEEKGDFRVSPKVAASEAWLGAAAACPRKVE